MRPSALRLTAFVLARVAAVLLLTALTLGHSSAQEGIGISGQWDIQVYGPIALDCTAAIEQTDADFSMALDCPALGQGDFAGTIDTNTGDITASGSIINVPVGLVGLASPDGDAISGYWGADFVGLSGTFTGTRQGPIETPTPLPTFAAPVDASGTWTTEVSGIFGGSCVSVLLQDGTRLVGAAACDVSFVSGLELTGSIDPLTGAFSIAGSGIEIEGQLAADGNSFTGTWDAFGFVSGTLSGTRANDAAIIDLSGKWDVFSNTLPPCSLSVGQESIMATATFDCLGGETQLTGIVNPFTNSLSLHDDAAEDGMRLKATAAPDLSSMSGWWVLSSEDHSTDFVAVPHDRAAQGILAIDCDAGTPGLQTECFVARGATLTAQLYVVAPPAGGYHGLLADLGWGAVLQSAAGDDLSAPTPCGTVERTALSDGVILRCQDLPGKTVTGGILEVPLTCADIGEAVLGFFTGTGEPVTTFFDTNGSPIAPTLISASVRCYSGGLGGPGPLLGDADCNGRTNSVDAALVLQLNAALIDTLPCSSYADVNGDESATSVDAALILQYSAELIDGFPS